jgi:hypothetical protein
VHHAQLGCLLDQPVHPFVRWHAHRDLNGRSGFTFDRMVVANGYVNRLSAHGGDDGVVFAATAIE